MSEPQADQANIFQRTKRRLEQARPTAEVRFIACELTISSIYNLLSNKLEWEIHEVDLWDYAYALRDIRICLNELRSSDKSAQIPYSKILDPLQRAIREVGEALRPRNVFASQRSAHIQGFVYWLDRTLQLMKVLGHPSP